MKISVTDQTHNFETLLRDLAARPVSLFDKTRLKQKVSSVALKTKTPLKDLDLTFLFNYKIFPKAILTYLTQWELEQRKMEVGDTILQQVFIPPTKRFSQKLIFGVRVNNIIDEPHRRGFSYETIEGHVERGESTFTVEEQGDGLVFRIETFSSPGNMLTRLVGPICAVPYQAYCTRLALENVRLQIEPDAHRQMTT